MTFVLLPILPAHTHLISLNNLARLHRHGVMTRSVAATYPQHPTALTLRLRTQLAVSHINKLFGHGYSNWI